VALLPILTVPHPLLKQVSRPVREEEFGEALEKHMRDMAETMYAAPGVGLAGVQVGDLRCIIVCDPSETDAETGEKKRTGLLLLVNPEILETTRKPITWEEGCLSVPDFWEDVTRPERAHLRWRGPDGESHKRWFEGFPAVIVQHEMDHLEGIVILDKVSRLKRTRYLKKVKKAGELTQINS
jgi:peptide deformylase